MPREGTYLLWIDYSALAVNEDELRIGLLMRQR